MLGMNNQKRDLMGVANRQEIVAKTLDFLNGLCYNMHILTIKVD